MFITMSWLTLVLLVVALHDSGTLIVSIKTPDGSVNMDSLVSQMTLLEQIVTTLQQDARAQNTEIIELKTKVGLLQSQLGTGYLTSEVNSLKDELFATKTELRSVSSEVISVNADLKTMTSEYTSLQIQINDTDTVVQGLQVSIESGIQLLNSSLQTQINTTQAFAREVSGNKHALQSFHKNLDAVNSSLSGNFANFKQTTNKAVQFLQNETSDLQTKLNSTQSTLKDTTRLFDNVVNMLNTTMKDASLMKTDVTLVNQRMSDLTRNLQTTSNTMSSRIETVNKTIQTQNAVTSGQVNRNMNSLQTLQANLAKVNSTLLQSTIVLTTELNSVVTSVKDQRSELGTTLKRFNATEKDTSLLKTDVALINSKVLSMTRNLQAIDSKVLSMTRNVQAIDSKVLSMTRNLQTMTQTVSRLSPIVDRLNVEVSFEVTNPVSYSPGSTIRFTNINHNYGGGYDSSTGTFTAPVSGVYLFWTQIDKQTGSEMTVYLYSLYSFYSFIPVAGDVTGTIIGSIHLSAGNTVYVKTTSATEIFKGGYSTFGGVLVRKH